MVTVRQREHPPRYPRWISFIGSLLIIVGALLLLLVGGLYAYGQMEEQRYARESDERRAAFETERAALAQQEDEESLAEEERARIDAERARLLETPLPSFGGSAPAPTATPRPKISRPARRIVIPAIGVDSEVVEAEIKNGEWEVPKFVVGHLQGTANPGDTGNAVYSGHLQSASSGNVFARLSELHVGDQIYLVSSDSQYLYEVQEIKVVANNDLSVVQPTPRPVVTLITCTGTWDFVRRDYLQRTIVVAIPYQDTPPARLGIQPR